MLNHVSLKCFIKFEGLSPGKSPVLIQIFRTSKVMVSSSQCKYIAQQILMSLPFSTIISGPCVEMITLISIYSPCTTRIILLYRTRGRQPLSQACSLLQKKMFCWKEGADLSSKLQKHPLTSSSTRLLLLWQESRGGFNSFCLVLLVLDFDKLLALVKYIARPFCWGFLDSSEYKRDF